MPKKGEAFKKGNRKCCFCGVGSTSKEHIWPKWAHPILPTGGEYHRAKYNGNRPAQRPWQRQGSIPDITIGAPCRECNSGWMGSLEEQVRSVLIKLIKQERCELTKENLADLSAYFTMKFMVTDLSAMSEETFSEPERRSFYENRTIPDGLNILLYNYNFEPDPFVAQYNKEHANEIVGDQQSIAAPVIIRPAPGVANYTIRFGYLLVQGLFLRGKQADFSPKPGSAVRAHVSYHAPMRWPPLFRLSLSEAQIVQHMIEVANPTQL